MRAPLAALTIVVTVGLGLGLVAALYTILNAMVFRVDEVRDPHELFGVARPPSAIAQPEPLTRADYDALLRETDLFADAFASTGDVRWVEGVRREGTAVTGNYFAVLGVAAERGRVLAPSDDEPGSLPVMVLSHRAWVQQYAADPGVVGLSLRVNGTLFEVIGVTPEDFRGLEVIAAPDFWTPLSLLDRERGDRPEAPNLDVVGRLAPGVTQGQALAQLVGWDVRRAAERGDDRSAAGLVLEPRRGTMPQPAQAMLLFMPLFFAFGLILLIG